MKQTTENLTRLDDVFISFCGHKIEAFKTRRCQPSWRSLILSDSRADKKDDLDLGQMLMLKCGTSLEASQRPKLEEVSHVKKVD